MRYIDKVPAVHLEVDEREHVCLVKCDVGQVLVFIGYAPETLRVKWTQRAPGSLTDPYGHDDYVTVGPDRGTLWRARLDPNFRGLLDRQDAAHFATIIERNEVLS